MIEDPIATLARLFRDGEITLRQYLAGVQIVMVAALEAHDER